MGTAAITLRHERIEASGGVTLHVAVAGAGRPVLLLHGFPENWRSWRQQIPALTSAGFSVLAPDLRGYNLSDVPAGKEAYQLSHLVDDVLALARATGHPRVHVVGHDWGGVVAWAFARKYPNHVEKLVIANAPHPTLYWKKARRPPQLFRSWYVLFFLLPRLPEIALSADGFRAVRRMFRRMPARQGTFSDEDIQQYVEGLSKPGALTAALNFYRANVQLGARHEWRSAPIEANTLVIWGDLDPALSTGLLDGLDRLVPRLRVHRIPDASHWVQNEAPDEFNRVVTEFLTG